jgi:hypothetical protein
MTTYSFDDSPYPTKHRTDLHLVYRIEDGQLKPYGLFERGRAADIELALLIKHDATWKIADVMCIGWGIVEGKVEHNTPLGA